MYLYKQIVCCILSYQLYFALKQHQVHSLQWKDNMPLHHQEKALTSFKDLNFSNQPKILIKPNRIDFKVKV